MLLCQKVEPIKITDVLVQNNGPEYDRDCLTRSSFLVNMRLFDVRPEYRELINKIIDYMYWTLDLNYSDYATESSVAASTLGFPFSIIAIKFPNNKKAMINPQVIERSNSKVVGRSNCGCCRLKNKIEIMRYEWITISYFDRLGKLTVDEKVDRVGGGLSIQHELDHGLGFTIIDRFLQQGHSISELSGNLPENKEKYDY